MDTGNILAYDFGNRLIKGATDRADCSFLHASARLADGQLQSLVQRGDIEDVFIINNVPYIIGQRAYRYGAKFAEGADRYEDEYYQRFLGVTLWRTMEERRDVVLFAGHAPRDVHERDRIKSASVGMFKVEHQGEKRTYRVKSTHCWDEPIGGMMMKLLTHNGLGFLKNDYNDGEGLVIDIGGLTIDYIIMENAKPDYLSARSYVDANIVDAVDAFVGLIKARYPAELRTRNDLPREKLYDAIDSGVYQAGAHGELDVQREADEVCEAIVDSIMGFYQRYGGAQLDYVLLSGGGSALLEQRIRKRMMIDGKQRRGVELAHTRKDAQMANVLGAHKQAKLYRSLGVM